MPLREIDGLTVLGPMGKVAVVIGSKIRKLKKEQSLHPLCATKHHDLEVRIDTMLDLMQIFEDLGKKETGKVEVPN